jgi:hypothetical protein
MNSIESTLSILHANYPGKMCLLCILMAAQLDIVFFRLRRFEGYQEPLCIAYNLLMIFESQIEGAGK